MGVQVQTVRDHTCKIILLQRRHNINNNMFKVTVVHFTQKDTSNDISIVTIFQIVYKSSLNLLPNRRLKPVVSIVID